MYLYVKETLLHKDTEDEMEIVLFCFAVFLMSKSFP